ncbi:unnamed protein product [Blepharisma stoltei]|uniref:Kinesin-like protein n=1 Tax=Blepharisma stoltei TaxID=1481888 RepID=A0AAU9IXY0_9CILI|nr:unnamed protein product [Blepharisma stoltei]
MSDKSPQSTLTQRRSISRKDSELPEKDTAADEVIAESKGHINVVCRFRPFNDKEKEYGEKTSIEFNSDQKSVAVIGHDTAPLLFCFDRVFPSSTLQQEVYDAAGKPIIESVLEGFNGTILAYGQTSSGKTFTMSGPSVDDPLYQGIIPRMVKTIFQNIDEASEHLEFTVKVGYCEIYLEKIRDLLDPSKKSLKIMEDKVKGIFIEDLTEDYVYQESDMYQLMKFGTRNREVAETQMNEVSSRSHAIFMITISQSNTLDLSAKTGKLYLVDLAGSEKISKTGAEGKRLDELKKINRSLSTLGLVIFSLTDGKSTHIPYRDSKLTRILQDSLGGNSKTCLILTCSPSLYNEQETISTLRFGIRAKAIKNKPKVNKEHTVAELKILLAKAKEEIIKKDSKITLLERHIKDIGETLPNQTEDSEASNEFLKSAEYQELLQELEFERQQYSNEIEKSSKYKQELNSQTIKNQNLVKENDILNGKLMALVMAKQSIEDKLRDYEDTIQQLRAKNEMLENQILSFTNCNMQLEEKLTEKEAEIKKLASELLSVKEKDEIIADLNRRLKSQEEQLRVKLLTESNGRKMKSESVLISQKENLAAEIEEKNETIYKLNTEIEDLKRILEKTKKDHEQAEFFVKSKINTLERNLELLTLMYSNMNTQKAMAKMENEITEKKVKRKTERIEQLEKQLTKISEQAHGYKYKNNVLSKELNEMKDDLPNRAHNKIKKMIKGGNTRVLGIISPYAFQNDVIKNS